MVLTRAQNQPGADGILGTADDVQDADNTDSPGSTRARPTPRTPRTRCSCASTRQCRRPAGLDRQAARRPPDRSPAAGRHGDMGGDQAAGRRASSACCSTTRTSPTSRMLATDPYGKFIPGRHGLAAVRDRDRARRGRSRQPGAGAGKRAVLRHAVPDGHRAQRRPEAVRTPTTTRQRRRSRRPRTRTTRRRRTSPASPPAPTTTRCSTRTSSAVTAGATRTSRLSADPPDLPLRARPTGGRHQEHADQRHLGQAASPPWPSGSSAASADGWNGERLFQAARFVTEMEYQHLVFEEFARKMQPAIRPFHVYNPDINPAIPAEFAHAVYRFGHSMLTTTSPARRTPATAPSDNSAAAAHGVPEPARVLQRRSQPAR